MSEQNDWNKRVIDEFRANSGKVGGNFEGSDLLLLHTKGAKSGLPRINPLMTKDLGDGRYVIVASKAGAPKHPDWYFNIKANPNVHIEVGSDAFDAKATILDEPERTNIYEQMEASYAFFTEYRQKAGRVIPVITVERRES